jgi:SAM-dependent methyltransferase
MTGDSLYNAYAPIYHAAGQGRFGAYMADLVLRLLRQAGAAPRRALDIACGCGEALHVMSAAGLATVGVDRSAAMLQYAAASGAAALLQADMRALPVGAAPLMRQSFDLVTCFADSLNYLLDDGDLARVCADVAELLAPGGAFVFDMNTPRAYEAWDERELVIVDQPDLLIYHQLSFNPVAARGTGRIVWFAHAGEQWRRGEEVHTQRAWRAAEVQRALTGAGFVITQRYGVDGAPLTDADEPARVVTIGIAGTSQVLRGDW